MAHSPRGWTGARTPSGKKRVRQAERRAAINGPRASRAKTLVSKTIKIATGQLEGDASASLAEAFSALDRAAKAGAIHPNAAARRKSRLARNVGAALGGAAVQAGAKSTKTIGTAAAAKAAKARIAAGKAVKAKGAQTAAGKARAALAKAGRTDAERHEGEGGSGRRRGRRTEGPGDPGQGDGGAGRRSRPPRKARRRRRPRRRPPAKAARQGRGQEGAGDIRRQARRQGAGEEGSRQEGRVGRPGRTRRPAPPAAPRPRVPRPGVIHCPRLGPRAAAADAPDGDPAASMLGGVPIAAIALVLVSSIFHVAWNSLVKTSGDPLATSTRAVGLGVLAVTPFAVLAWLATGRPTLTPEGWVIAVASGIVSAAYFVPLSAAYRRGALSSVYPVARGSGALLGVVAGVVDPRRATRAARLPRGGAAPRRNAHGGARHGLARRRSRPPSWPGAPWPATRRSTGSASGRAPPGCTRGPSGRSAPSVSSGGGR